MKNIEGRPDGSLGLKDTTSRRHNEIFFLSFVKWF